MQLITNYISKQQRAKIFAAAKSLGIDNDNLKDLIMEWTGVSSLAGNNCTSGDANKIIENLNKYAVQTGTKGFATENEKAKSLRTDKQMSAIISLKKDLRWSENGFNSFVLKTTKENFNYNLLTFDNARKLIAGMQNILRWKRKKK